MEIGIVGLPNVGKSTIFNALTCGHAASSNYPFTTIEPNVGVVSVPDPRLKRLAEIFKPQKVTPAAIRFVDIAGLVKGASKGEGLGNQFLSHIREVDAILHLVRLFKDPNVVHTMGGVDPLRDVEVIETELILADLASVERQIEKAEPPARSGDKTSREKLELLKKLQAGLSQGRTARVLGLPEEAIRPFFLLTAKPILYAGNTEERLDGETARAVEERAKREGAGFVALCGKLEAEIAELPEQDRPAFLKEMRLEQAGLDRVILAAQKLLRLVQFFTGGPKEVRGWMVRSGATAPQAAGQIHSDMERGFIRAEVYGFEDIDRLGSEPAVREKGLIRLEGKEYVVREGDVCYFRFNV